MQSALPLPSLAERVCLRALTLVVDTEPCAERPATNPPAAAAEPPSSSAADSSAVASAAALPAASVPAASVPAAPAPREVTAPLRHHCCQLLLSLFTLDALSWTCFKV
jgi:hypothetical protein